MALIILETCSPPAHAGGYKNVAAMRLYTEPRSGGILLATGVSRWNLKGHDQPRSGDSRKLPRLQRLSSY
jgi:hypothetical protein